MTQVLWQGGRDTRRYNHPRHCNLPVPHCFPNSTLSSPWLCTTFLESLPCCGTGPRPGHLISRLLY